MENEVLTALEQCVKQLVTMYRIVAPLGNTGQGNRFADQDETIINARRVLKKYIPAMGGRVMELKPLETEMFPVMQEVLHAYKRARYSQSLPRK